MRFSRLRVSDRKTLLCYWVRRRLKSANGCVAHTISQSTHSYPSSMPLALPSYKSQLIIINETEGSEKRYRGSWAVCDNRHNFAPEKLNKTILEKRKDDEKDDDDRCHDGSNAECKCTESGSR